ncbi:NADPH-dependent F420 reductase [Georgenia subflava]|uniref:NADP oxidoreductase n=1 Tax=Georgenia subflava TaxID=1622177 RepID=A0A6N7EG79_9MICO|nr:NAD(P)-binding domain-containing protein [Georgenia subflava]MPV36183.1 NADP oxidoreductase [Georgenia subflava]
MTDITIIGAGNMTRGIATRALAGGHAVQILARDTAAAGTLAGELPGTVTTGPIGDAITGEIVVLALPYDAALAIAEQLREVLAGKIVVDITNPVDFATFDSLVTPDDSSSAEELAKVVPASKVVKAFNTTFAGPLVAGESDGHKLDVFVAADDAEAKAAVVSFVDSSGMRAIDAGALKRAQQLEGMGFLHMTLQGALGNTWSTGVKIVAA